MKEKMKALLLILVSVLVFLSCSEGSGAAVGLKIQSTQSVPVTGRSLSSAASGIVSIPVIAKDGSTELGTLSLSKAFIAVKEIEIEMVGTDDDESEYTGTFLVDLISNTVVPELPLIDLPEGLYDEIELEIDKLDDLDTDGNGTALANPENKMAQRSLYLEGLYTPESGTAVNFVLAYDSEEEIILVDEDSVNSFEVRDMTELIIAFRMDHWFNFSNQDTNPFSLDFSDLTADILLDESCLVDSIEFKIREIIQENIEESADFGVDIDGDGELGEDEDDD